MNSFRWVEGQLRPLRRCARSVKHLEKCLRALLQSLDGTYERMLYGIDIESQDDAKRILALLCYSPRPLTVDEVIEALVVDLDDMECYDSDRKLESADDLFGFIRASLKLVSPLLRITAMILERRKKRRTKEILATRRRRVLQLFASPIFRYKNTLYLTESNEAVLPTLPCLALFNTRRSARLACFTSKTRDFCRKP